jgi:magnesium-transporting ATPase (P-type)
MVVAFVPEGLMPTVTLALRDGNRSAMAYRKALIKKLSAVDTLAVPMLSALIKPER